MKSQLSFVTYAICNRLRQRTYSAAHSLLGMDFCTSTTTVHSGTRYEEHTAQVLSEYLFDLVRVGGASDRGVDLAGTWKISQMPFHGLSDGLKNGALDNPVVVQCKNHARKLGPVHIRELDGTLTKRSNGTIGLLVCPKGFSPMCISRANASPFAIGLVVINNDLDDVVGFHINHAFEKLKPDITIGTRHPSRENVFSRKPFILHKSECGMISKVERGRTSPPSGET
eukprot:CFRG7683T1